MMTYDMSDAKEFTSVWDRYSQNFTPLIACPECEHSDRVGQVEYERFELFGGIYEPVGYWVICGNCGGSGKILKD